MREAISRAISRRRRGIKCRKLLLELLVGRGQGAVASGVYNNNNRIRLLMAVNVKHEESRKQHY